MKSNGILKLKVVVEKLLQKSLLLQWHFKNTTSRLVPQDVKQGHFAVIAADHVDHEIRKRFVVPLAYLARPAFQRLLEKAAEEYGFNHKGALMVPCRPWELEWILAERSTRSG